MVRGGDGDSSGVPVPPGVCRSKWGGERTTQEEWTTADTVKGTTAAWEAYNIAYYMALMA